MKDTIGKISYKDTVDTAKSLWKTIIKTIATNTLVSSVLTVGRELVSSISFSLKGLSKMKSLAGHTDTINKFIKKLGVFEKALFMGNMILEVITLKAILLDDPDKEGAQEEYEEKLKKALFSVGTAFVKAELVAYAFGSGGVHGVAAYGLVAGASSMFINNYIQNN